MKTDPEHLLGNIWWVDFGTPVGSEPGYIRPVVIVSSDSFNRSRISTVIVSTVTSNLRLSEAPGNVALLMAKTINTGLDRDCVVNVSQTLVIDRNRLLAKSGTLDGSSLKQVQDGLRLVFNL